MARNERVDLTDLVASFREALVLLKEGVERNTKESRSTRREIIDKIDKVLDRIDQMSGAFERMAMVVELREQADAERDQSINATLRQRGDASGPVPLLSAPPAPYRDPVPPTAPKEPPKEPSLTEDLAQIGGVWPAVLRVLRRLWEVRRAVAFAIATGVLSIAGVKGCEARHRAEEQQRAAPPDMSVPLDLAEARAALDAGTPPGPKPKKRRRAPLPVPDEKHDAMVPAAAAPFTSHHRCTDAPYEPEDCARPGR